MKIDSGSGAQGGNLGGRDGFKNQRYFPAEFCARACGAAIDDDGFEIHQSIASRGRKMNAKRK